MKFRLFRYYLTPVDISLFEGDALSKSKQQIMAEVLNDEIDFIRAGYDHAYIKRALLGERYLVSQIGKKVTEPHYEKTNSKFRTVDQEEWPYRYVVFDLNDKVQLIAFEIKDANKFGNPNSILKELKEQLNTPLKKYGWRIEIEPTIDESKFWEVIERHRTVIKSLKFTYYVPNLFGVDDALSEELDEAKKVYGAQTVKTELKNEDGNLVVPHTPMVEESVNHIKKGGGRYVIELKNHRKYKSGENALHVDIEEATLTFDNYEALLKVIEKIFEK